MNRIRRRAYEAGHTAKFLVVVDETPEADRALYFAARRAARINAIVLALGVVNLEDVQEILGVGDIMRAEAEETIQKLLDKAAARARTIAGIEIERLMLHGSTSDVIQKLIAEDEDIAILVLAAGVGNEGPGPLVLALASKGAAHFPVPVTIVPGTLTDAEIDALA